MMMSHWKFITLCLCYLTIALQYTNAQDAVAFEESIEDTLKLPADNRRPVENRQECDENELYYPGDNNDDWICDCRPSYIYYPDRSKCFPAFKKGPCKDNEYLIMPNNSYVPVCEKNPCYKEGFVRISRRCVQLGTACNIDSRRRYGVEEGTLIPKCLPPPNEQIASRFSPEETGAQGTNEGKINYCFRGCKRYFNKTCPGQAV
ncbi:uncharacterized protein LOC143921030 [Arctopsyche grandis]|uniref:uncharacterized protein LOC143921030 n=1 Tax=Arctopsyche grandis TaxID=121162 RepID=UPI00406D8674